MGREIRRVPLDFDWPLEKVWDGFVNPHYRNCQACDGHGETRARVQLRRLASLLAWAGYCASRSDGISPRPTNWHPMFDSTGLDAPMAPELVQVINGFCRAGDRVWLAEHQEYAGREPSGMQGIGAGDDYKIELALLSTSGLPSDWGKCARCDGSGIASDARAAYDAWKPTDPPAGEGWQVWETVSEGSPITPVFATADDLVTHLVSVPSMIMQVSPAGGRIWNDIESCHPAANFFPNREGG